ncbi:carboxypeptidase-like regulatory domain-containing protein [Maribacter sp. 2308TA10-17]|uniref:carboxypeptidase-like regulatory domain-containing protein n=1 Tax=Maribacter sp. 2308TA10-17 TaxID=3386276 RepID=UPI0039BC2530
MRLKRYLFIPFLLMIHFALNAQNYQTKIEGRVFAKDSDVAATHVSNISSNKGTITDANGFFTISVKLNDTLVFSAVQYKQKELVVDLSILETELVTVILEAAITELNEVVVMPYNLSGALDRDMSKLKIGPIITASTENLPNSNLEPITQAQRQLYTARTWDLQIGFGFKVDTDPIFNYFSGRTKMLNERIARDSNVEMIKEVRKYYKDSLYISNLKIPKKHIDDFVYFCETDSNFASLVSDNDKLKLWEFMRKQSSKYRKNNDLD